MTRRYKALRGTKDILPADTPKWQWVEQSARRLFARYGFQEIRTPVIESTELFARSVGPSSDIVRKEMYTFGTGEESFSLRPECTASVVRAFVEHALHRRVAVGYPERYFYIGPMFRRERPQKGRQRQFHQIGVEVLGAGEPRADAETIEMADALLAALRIRESEILLNSVGDRTCRPRYRERLCAWLEPRLSRLCGDCNRRYRENPLRVFDCKIEADRALLENAPRMNDSLCDGCRAHFAEVVHDLDALGVGYRIDPRIVRGLDYYERTVFEITSPALGAQNAILGGGRYDGLVEELGGPCMPGFGFAIGMERLISLVPDDRVPPTAVDLALVSLGREGWQAASGIAQRLRSNGIGCAVPMLERPMGAQLRRADRIGARFVLFVGGDEVAAGRFSLKDLRSGKQIEASESEVVSHVKGSQQ